MAKKIVELSKKNRELAAEVARQRFRAKELQETVSKLEVSCPWVCRCRGPVPSDTEQAILFVSNIHDSQKSLYCIN